MTNSIATRFCLTCLSIAFLVVGATTSNADFGGCTGTVIENGQGTLQVHQLHL